MSIIGFSPLWAAINFIVGVGVGVLIRRADTSRRFGARELQLEFYNAQDNRLLPDRIYPPWWEEHISDERRRLWDQQRREWIVIAFGACSMLLFLVQALVPAVRILTSPTLIFFVLLSVCAIAWYRLMAPALHADLDELSRQAESRAI
ncbi:hypothetical protein AB0N05_12275 [Nocardia sp. NPDC051030]|uniref:hypothetical protein n=1 Tax=Nocardia sp. NPDC051030 TaxID=3155162 RepID=UPI00341B3DF0